MSDLVNKVPESAVVAEFAGVMAISPELYGMRLEGLAKRHRVACDEFFKKYVMGVLEKQPKQPPDDFD